MLFLLYFITELFHTKIKIKSPANTNTKQFSYIFIFNLFYWHWQVYYFNLLLIDLLSILDMK